MADKKDLRRSKSKPESSWWQPHYILLLIIILQGGFIIFMAIRGPAHHHTAAKVAPHGSKKGWNAEPNSASQDRQERLRQKIDQAAKITIHPDAMEKHQAKLLMAKTKTKVPQETSPPQYKHMLQEKEWEVNSKDFPGALHFHFVQEQRSPFFRNQRPKTNEQLMEKWEQAAKVAGEKMVRKKAVLKSCYYYSKETQQLRLMEWCFNVGRQHYKGLIVYNPKPFPRTWCGKLIEPNGIQHFAKLCPHAYTEPPRLLLSESDKVLGILRKDFRNLPPIVFERKDSYGSIEEVQDCDVPCKFSMDTCMDENDKDIKGAACLPEISDFTVQGTDFKFRYSMLDPRLAPTQIGISRKGYRENQFYATRSFQSEIPLSTFDWGKYGEMNTPKNDFHKAGQKGICFIHLEPCTGEIRPGSWTAKVQEAFKGQFDYYGPCGFGPKMKPTATDLDLNKFQDRQSIMGQYMFTMVIGHSSNPDMMTDLIWDALAAGSIPVYHGAPNVREHVPPNSIITGGEHSDQEALAEHLNKIKESEQLWNEYHLWRDEETSTSLIEQKYGFLKQKSSSPYCRMCRFALATKYGLRWDPVKQAIEKPTADRKFCTSPKDELKFPVEEIWMSDLSMQKMFGKKVCDKEWAEQTMKFDDVSVTRRVISHDNGMVDIAITDIKSLRQNLKLVLRLRVQGMRNAHGSHIIEPHQVLNKSENPSDHIPLMSSITIQDDKTRATIITNWVTTLGTPKGEGLVDVLVRDLRKPGDGKPKEPKRDEIADPQKPRLMEDETLRIRIIVEDVNPLRDGSTEYNLSPYARLMMTDFLEPLMFFYDSNL